MRSYSYSGSFLIVLALCLASPAASRAQSVAEPKNWTLTPFLGGSFGTSNDLGSSLTLGAAIGYDLTSNLGFEAELGYVFDVAGDNANVDWSLTNFSANAIYHFDVRRVTPYATFGLGVERSNLTIDEPDILALFPPDSNEIAYNFGGGVKYPLSDRFLARADLRRFQATDIAPDHWRLYGGLTWWIKRQ
jgi:opacity protein-like surface antigen